MFHSEYDIETGNIDPKANEWIDRKKLTEVSSIGHVCSRCGHIHMADPPWIEYAKQKGREELFFKRTCRRCRYGWEEEIEEVA